MKSKVVLAVLLLVGLMVLLSACGGGTGELIQIKGSDTEVNLVQTLAEEFMAENKDVQLAVTGGGSGTGIAALLNGTADIANSSRAMSEEEIEQAREKGIDPRAFVFAMDGLSVIVNANNQLTELTLDDLGAVFRGELTNWQQLGGADLPISLYGRQNNSGTYVFFREQVLKGDYSISMRGMNGNAQIVEAVAQDPAGIGYVGIGYTQDEQGLVPGIKVLNLKTDDQAPAVSPLDLENITSGRYPLTRPLYHYTNGRPEGGLRLFLEFELGSEGQEIVLQEGFYPVAEQFRKLNQENLEP